jgi:hypothetical protein
MRKLASIQVVSALSPIPDSNNIEVATILGWKVVVKKGEFNVGDRCVYCEIDSILPERPEFEFLRKSKFRIKTIKLRGQISQGIVFPLSVLPQHEIKCAVGNDVTELLGVLKYETPDEAEKPMRKHSRSAFMKFLFKFKIFRKLFVENKVRGEWPEGMPHTDETRIQAITEVLDKYGDVEFNISEKLDGQSGSYFLYRRKSLFGFKDCLGVCSRTIWKKTNDNSNWWKIAIAENIEKKLKMSQGRYVVQGEIVGSGIQGNKLRLPKVCFYVHNVLNKSNSYEPLTPDEMKRFCETYGFKHVPYLGTVKLSDFTVDTLVEFAKGNSVITPSVLREGIVLRPTTNIVDKKLGWLSFKVINNDFLLKHQ